MKIFWTRNMKKEIKLSTKRQCMPKRSKKNEGRYKLRDVNNLHKNIK